MEFSWTREHLGLPCWHWLPGCMAYLHLFRKWFTEVFWI